MIIQGLLDFISQWVAGVVSLIPALPAQYAQAFAWLGTAGTFATSWVSPLGVLIPFDVISTIVQAWLGLLAFWLAMVAFRLVLWLFGR